MLYKQFVAWNCNGYSIVLLTDYINEDTYFETSDERIYLDLRDSMGYSNEMKKLMRNDSNLLLKMELKNPLLRKMRLRVWGYSMGEYLYILADSGLTLKYKTYSIVAQGNDVEE